jgi:DNA-binding transcriptional LysR family regulator
MSNAMGRPITPLVLSRDEFAREVGRLDQFGLHERPPLGPRRHRRRSGSAEFRSEKGIERVKVHGHVRSSSADVLRYFALQEQGIVLATGWSVAQEIQAGLLVPLLERYEPAPAGSPF